MRRRHRIRPLRLRIFFGCEGESEQSYGTMLHKLIEDQGRLHIDAIPLQPGGGDPLAIVERALLLIQRREREYGARYAHRAVLLDHDKIDNCPSRDQQIQAHIVAGKIQLIWQYPCHEALLLRHIPGCHALRPLLPADAFQKLLSYWPDYRKGVPTAYLQQRLSIDDLRRACTVESELSAFLNTIGYFR
jgi:hypothetical protein